MELWLALTRFVHYGSSLVLFGLVLFPLYACLAVNGRSVAGRTSAILLPVSLIVVVSGIFWFIAIATAMSEDRLSFETARFILMETSFGTVFLLRLVVMIVATGMILTLIRRDSSKKLEQSLIAICAILVGSLAWVGHTQIEDGLAGAAHILSDVIHLLAAGAWLGGLVSLLDLLVRSLSSKTAADQAREAALRFSKMGYIAVVALAVSGLINSWFLVSSVKNLLVTSYGQFLSLKLVFFSLMIGFAVYNRVFVVPGLRYPDAISAKPRLHRLLINVIAEQSSGFAIIMIVAWLGITEPPALPQ